MTVDVPAGFGLSDHALKPQIDTAARNSHKLSQEEIDAGLEREIEATMREWLRLSDACGRGELPHEASREAYETFVRLIHQRSDEQKARMEGKLPKPWGSR